MSSISVVQYNTPNQSPVKMNVLLQNYNNQNSKKREVLVLRKQQPILPQPESFIVKDEVLATNQTKVIQKVAKPKPAAKTSPQPVAVARRNARERNRVKQVNNGFANLRQHIPNFIAATFESNNGRGGNKKLSKVETLRMAVEYIRSLEEILNMDRPESETINQSNQSQIYNYSVLSPSEDGFEEDEISIAQSPSPQQFIKINTSNNNYQIIQSNIYENGENMDPMVQSHMLAENLMGTNLEFTQDLSYLNNMNASASLSPGMYSEESLSPNSMDRGDQKCFIPVFNTPPHEDVQTRLSPPVHLKTEAVELPLIHLKTESPEKNKINVIDVIQWWEHQQQPNTIS